ncbi:hypothetical protein NHQ30_011281 [Ciborinia camelliae]|nr:hypothetical protein NHQ30_011281 [Ciborinia camelliae]
MAKAIIIGRPERPPSSSDANGGSTPANTSASRTPSIKRPKLGTRKSSGTIIVPRASTNFRKEIIHVEVPVTACTSGRGMSLLARPIHEATITDFGPFPISEPNSTEGLCSPSEKHCISARPGRTDHCRRLQAEDARSVHFLALPDVREELFDVEVERRSLQPADSVAQDDPIRFREGDSHCVVEAIVYGVQLPSHDGRAGCAAVFIDPSINNFDWASLSKISPMLESELNNFPAYNSLGRIKSSTGNDLSGAATYARTPSRIFSIQSPVLVQQTLHSPRTLDPPQKQYFNVFAQGRTRHRTSETESIKNLESSSSYGAFTTKGLLEDYERLNTSPVETSNNPSHTNQTKAQEPEQEDEVARLERLISEAAAANSNICKPSMP